ncbi:hypothetical protein [Vibrio algarum]|uniref:Uncharacterized protein n=1 Tax=Vibrio algarum TaxID=3020714 RepID=A0ABT4YMQ6_9VIBR|nr:hypothetical protein [Vibrio sp. KJ40-1]MDB1122832.1 hypothetical protein [Vibrio sp. KJ40-1]
MEQITDNPTIDMNEQETRSKEAVSALISEMDGEDFDTNEVVQDNAQKRKEDAKKAADAVALNLAKENAAKGVAAFDFGLKLADERLGVDDMQGGLLVETAAPVLMKYAVEPPQWFKDWGAEMQLAGAFCFVAFMQYKTLIELRKIDAARAKEALKRGDKDGTH